MAATISCPGCGAQVVVTSTVTVFMTCSFCKSSLMRNGVNWEHYGEIGELMPEETVLQIGAQMRWLGQKMSLLGRIQRKWEHGTWSEWYAEGGGQRGWLAFAQGDYMVTSLTSAKPATTEWDDLRVGKEVLLSSGASFVVLDRKESKIIAVEGELPEPYKVGEQTRSLDAANERGDFLTVEWTGKGVAVYLGRMTNFDQLNLSNVRKLDGWS